jgi:hypothetical protein
MTSFKEDLSATREMVGPKVIQLNQIICPYRAFFEGCEIDTNLLTLFYHTAVYSNPVNDDSALLGPFTLMKFRRYAYYDRGHKYHGTPGCLHQLFGRSNRRGRRHDVQYTSRMLYAQGLAFYLPGLERSEPQAELADVWSCARFVEAFMIL